MKLWYLEPTDNGQGDIWGNIPHTHPHTTYDCNTFIIVRAEDEAQARALASKIAKDETPECWLNPYWSTCVEYTFPTTDGDAEVVWSEVHPG